MSSVDVFFTGWAPVLRILVVGVSMYAALVALFRLSGSRTLASMNAFDFIVTVAIGSAFGRALTARDVALAEALTAFVLLISLQYVVGWWRVRSDRFERLITNPPILLYYRDGFLRDAMRAEQVTEDEIRSAVRKEEFGSLDDVQAVILESNGEVSVVQSVGDGSAMGDVLLGVEEHEEG